MRWTMCFSLLVLIPTAGRTADHSATINYLQGLQQPDGSFLAAAPDRKLDQKPQGGLRATSGAIRALKYFGGQVPDRDAAAKFVQSCFDEKTGGFSDRPGGKPDVALTAVGLMAVVELKLPTEQYARAVRFMTENAQKFEEVRIAVAGLEAVQSFPGIVRSWHQDVVRDSNGDGTWGKEDKPRATGSAVALLLRSGGKLDDMQKKNALSAIRDGQRDDGGFSKDSKSASELETTYRIMRACLLMKEKHTDPAKLRAFIGKCRNDDGGYGVAPGQPSSVSGTYFAGIILHWLDAK